MSSDTGKVLVAGASGRLGRHVRSELAARGRATRALVRDAKRVEAAGAGEVFVGDARAAESLRGACEGVAAVVSALGASLALGLTPKRATFREIDLRANLNLLAEAKRAGVGKFVYVSLYGAETLRGLAYVDAHEEFVAALRASGLEHAVVRPTGFFYVFGEIFKMAARGRVALVGDGSARTNPVHERDVALACVAGLDADVKELAVGGPETYTRRGVAEMAFAALGRPPKISSLPPRVVLALTAPLKLFDRRLYDLLEFGVAASTTDLIAPAYGERSLAEYFRRLASGAGEV
ncbi:MAG: SDR family oxidoreductase [Pyrinomonadaceae bacterium]